MATYLPQNKFMDSVTPRSPAVTDTAGVSPCPPDAPAGTIAAFSSLISELGAGLSGAPVQESPLVNHEPPSNEGRPEEAPAGSAPPNTTAAPAGVSGDRLDWHEFWNAITDERIVLFEPFVEHPLFIIEDGRLQRLEA